jgi:hypothetical protein
MMTSDPVLVCAVVPPGGDGVAVGLARRALPLRTWQIGCI